MGNPFATAATPVTETTETTEETKVEETVENTTPENTAEAPVEEVTTTEAETNDENESSNEGDKPKKKRQRHVESNAPRKTSEQVKYIIANYKDNTVADLMKDPFLEGLTEQQIRKTVFDAKKALKDQAEAMEDEDKKKKLLAWIEENLPNRSADKKGGKRGTVMDSALDDIMSSVFGN